MWKGGMSLERRDEMRLEGRDWMRLERRDWMRLERRDWMRLKGRDGMRWEKINIFCTSGTWVGSLLSLLLPCLEK